MTLIAAGTGLRKRAQQGFAANAKLEGQEIAAAEALETARNAQQMNTLGTGAGIGGMYGLKKLAATKAAPAVGEAFMAGAPEVAKLTGDASMMLTDGKLAAMGAEGVATTTATTTGAAGAGAAGAGTGAAAAGTGAAATGAGAAGAGAAGAGAGAAGAGTAAAGAGSGALAGLSAVAAPIAIGLGVAYLINKLFD